MEAGDAAIGEAAMMATRALMLCARLPVHQACVRGFCELDSAVARVTDFVAPGPPRQDNQKKSRGICKPVSSTGAAATPRASSSRRAGSKTIDSISPADRKRFNNARASGMPNNDVIARNKRKVLRRKPAPKAILSSESDPESDAEITMIDECVEEAGIENVNSNNHAARVVVKTEPLPRDKAMPSSPPGGVKTVTARELPRVERKAGLPPREDVYCGMFTLVDANVLFPL